MNKTKLYNELAWTWEIMISGEEYVPEVNFLKRMIKRYKKTQGNELLDVGCGAGPHDLLLKEDFRVEGVDASEKMLHLARKRNPELTYSLGDVRTLRLNRQFDVVIAMDMIMYNLTYEDLESSLVSLSDHIKPGGVLVFYVVDLKEKFEQNKTRVKNHKKGDLEIVLIENDYDPDPHDTECEYYLIFLIRKEGKLKIEIDKHRVGLFELERIIGILERLKLKPHLFELDFSGRKFQKEGPVFVCEKLA
jgi:trans-aconitate methyltransferase